MGSIETCRLGLGVRRAPVRLLLLLSILVPASHAMPPGGNNNGNGNPPGHLKIHMQNRITLEPVLASELLTGPAAVAFVGVDPAVPVHNAFVQREVQDLWRVHVHPQGGLPAVQIEYEVTALNGARGFLSSISAPASMMQVAVEELPLSMEVTPGIVKVHGSVRFHFDVTPATVSGGYGGTLLVTISTL